jgi:AcrR family transcriptional regulator
MMSPVPRLSRARPPARKRLDRYHHGDLQRALLEQAIRTIQAEGPEALTLRAVGAALGVSRTALYRHFADKGALLEAVAREGFRLLRLALTAAWEQAGGGRAGFEAMGLAYIRFALSHPSHYRVMFGGARGDEPGDPELVTEASAAFQVLVHAIGTQQRLGLVRQEDPEQLARYIWAVVHGIAMLAIDGQLRRQRADVELLARYAIARIRTGIAASAAPEP